jgi:hypothetical protein
VTTTRLLTRTAIRELVRSRAYRLGFATISLFFVAIIDVIGVLLWLGPSLHGLIDRAAVATALSTIVYVTVVLLAGLSLNISSAQPLIRAKASGSIESLLATPATAQDIWIARSLAASIPGILAGLVGGVITLIVLNLVYVVPRGLSLIVPAWTLVSSFVLLPTIFLLLGFVIHLVGLPGNPISGNVIAQIFVPAYASLSINLAVRNVLSPARVDIALVEFGMILVLAVLASALRGRVTKERIILSCKR